MKAKMLACTMLVIATIVLSPFSRPQGTQQHLPPALSKRLSGMKPSRSASGLEADVNPVYHSKQPISSYSARIVVPELPAKPAEEYVYGANGLDDALGMLWFCNEYPSCNHQGWVFDVGASEPVTSSIPVLPGDLIDFAVSSKSGYWAVQVIISRHGKLLSKKESRFKRASPAYEAYVNVFGADALGSSSCRVLPSNGKVEVNNISIAPQYDVKNWTVDKNIAHGDCQIDVSMPSESSNRVVIRWH